MSNDCKEIIENSKINSEFVSKNKSRLSSNVAIKEYLYFSNKNANESYFIIYHNNERYKVNANYLYYLIGLKDCVQHQFNKITKNINNLDDKLNLLEKEECSEKTNNKLNIILY